jgi:hypothetical protein
MKKAAAFICGFLRCGGSAAPGLYFTVTWIDALMGAP